MADKQVVHRIGIFGGSFNPIHAGHIGVALAAAREHALDKVLVVPAACSPFKTDAADVMPAALRWRLVKVACAGHPELSPCDAELRRGGVSYAIDTVREIAASHPGAEVFFIVGEDAYASIHLWKDYDELSRLAKFVSFPRTRESSTEIRRRMAAGEPLDDLVSPAVEEWLSAAGVVFDYGGVLAYPPGSAWAVYGKCAALGLEKARVKAGFEKHRYRWDGGFCSGRDMYRDIFRDNGLTPPDAALDELVHLDSAGWTRICPESLALVKALKAAGRKVGVLTNMSEEFYDGYFVKCAGELAEAADALVVSGFHRLFKPEKPIYDLMASKLELDPARLLFLDDREENVAAARRFGWRAQLFSCLD